MKKRDRFKASYDLHLHSCWSYDAGVSVENYFKMAQHDGLEAFAITDHHHFDSADELFETAKKYPDVKFFTGAEFSASTPFGDMDFVCLGLPRKPTAGLQGLYDEMHLYLNNMGKASTIIAERMKHTFTEAERRNIMLQYRPEKVIDFQGDSYAKHELQSQYLIQKGVVSTIEEWGYAIWSDPAHDDIRPKLPTAERVSQIIHEAGGVVIIAHPYHYFNGADRKRMDALREYVNFDGIECAHPLIPPYYGAVYRQYCLKNKLLSSGGTDLHFDSALLKKFNMPEYTIFAEHAGAECYLDELKERITLHNGC